MVSIFGRCMYEPWIPGEWNGNGTTIVQLGDERIIRDHHILCMHPLYLKR